jgi:serine/threonine-protein kinase
VLGDKRIGKYEVIDHLASGGMGQVYLARATGLGGFERRVVIKTLDTNDTEDEDPFVTMFLDEARLLGRLHHQYIAPIYEVGCDDEGRYYLVMDYVHGETAEAIWKRQDQRSAPLTLPFALTIVSAIASALDYAHALCGLDGAPLDIVHRDVSLSNVMVGYDGSVKLIDFGIAKAAGRATKTANGMLKGKMAYLAPEQVLHKPIDHRTDIFALGIVLYELTTMRRAFREDSDLLTLERIAYGHLTPPSQAMRGYPLELEAIVMKALAVNPERRYQTAGAFGAAIEAFAMGRGIALGHAAIISEMKHLFSARRRRFARSSNDIASDPAIPTISDLDTELTPVRAMRDEIVMLERPVTASVVSPVVEPVVEIDQDETTEPREMPLVNRPAPVRRVRFTSAPTLPLLSPLVAASPSPFSGAAVVRPIAPRHTEPWWIAIGLFVLAMIIAILH